MSPIRIPANSNFSITYHAIYLLKDPLLVLVLMIPGYYVPSKSRTWLQTLLPNNWTSTKGIPAKLDKHVHAAGGNRNIPSPPTPHVKRRCPVRPSIVIIMAAAKTLIRPYVLSCAALRSTIPPLRLCRFLSTKPFDSKKIASASYRQTNQGTHGPSSTKSEGGYSPRRRFSIKATHVSESGSIDSPMIHSMEKKIKEQLNADEVTVKDAYGDGRHVSIDVISSAFEGQSAVNRQRMVYKAIWEELQTTVHAVDQMTTRTPAEAASAS